MNFIKKNIIKIEIIFSVIIFLIILISYLSYATFFSDIFGISKIEISFFEDLWLNLFYINLVFIGYGGIDIIINLFFYFFLLLFPVLGLFFRREKIKFIILHIALMALILIHLLSLGLFYFTLEGIART